MKRIFQNVFAGTTLVALMAFGVGCATVEPYQKGNLSDYTMRSDRDELASVMNSHIQFSREASTGGEGVGGGGCGCN
jgi:hypothetical protein